LPWISHQADYQTGDEKTQAAASLDDALKIASRADCEQDQLFIIGGGAIYELALPRAERLYLTRVHADVEGDVSFPVVDWQQWELKEQSKHTADPLNDFPYSFEMYQRVAT
jgi:dihydrofolate reductase